MSEGAWRAESFMLLSLRLSDQRRPGSQFRDRAGACRRGRRPDTGRLEASFRPSSPRLLEVAGHGGITLSVVGVRRRDPCEDRARRGRRQGESGTVTPAAVGARRRSSRGRSQGKSENETEAKKESANRVRVLLHGTPPVSKIGRRVLPQTDSASCPGRAKPRARGLARRFPRDRARREPGRAAGRGRR